MGVHVLAPGRVNLIGDHTDYTGGLVLPMAIDRYTEIKGNRTADRVQLSSLDEEQPVDLALHIERPQDAEPAWGKYVAGVISEMPNPHGFQGRVTTDIPIGAGLSSSAALEIAVALAIGFTGTPLELAQLCQRAENRASGVPSGIMDQLAIAAGVAGHALLIDCSDLTVQPIAIPRGVEIVVQFIEHRSLIGSPYAERVAECAAAEQIIGPLRHTTAAQARTITDPVVRARAVHVTSENRRVIDFADAITSGDLREAGRLMVQSHASLRDLYKTSTRAMDAAVAEVCAIPGVFGARMTGGGFGGCLVALTEPGALNEGWVVRAVAGASISVTS
ncbi:MAG TPA: galactokinase family protein [Ilumatobacteraceae bacterium]|nr:galactokinase family protein [Ilumatobacteraceae bacterium]